jgi:NAD-dependent SIR2 family protein deacetylase
MKRDLTNDDAWQENANALVHAANRTSAMGRQVLVVIGAGCSVAAGMPQMQEVYHNLHGRISGIAPAVRAKHQVAALLAWLASLEKGTAPRSIAAKALGTLQTAHRLSDIDVATALKEVWLEFSEAFVSGKIGQLPTTDETSNAGGVHPGPVDVISPTLFTNHEEFRPIFARPPTKFHNAVADWVISRRAFVVSVNFDGLTRKAIRLRSQEHNAKSACVVLNAPPQLRSYFLGEQYRPDAPLFCVVKVWGDVFHAVCRNPGCAEADKEVPIYLLEEPGKEKFIQTDIQHALACPECAAPRQLQVFFPGYQKKEAQTTELMQALWAYVSARIGLILVVGLSGIWDNALVEFLTDISRDLQREGVETPLFCVDPSPTAYLPAELRHRGINIVHVCTSAERIAEFCPPKSAGKRAITHAKASRVGETDNLWAGLIDRDVLESRTPHGYEQIHSLNYLQGFEKLRQLGLKTRLTKRGRAEIDHNRLKHSLGASNLAWYWITTLLGNDKTDYSSTLRAIVPPPIIESLAILAAVHHDLGHLPFTHLAEEVFRELNWTTSPWSSHFRHDEQVFMTARSTLVEKARSTIEGAAGGLAINPPAAFVEWTQRAGLSS